MRSGTESVKGNDTIKKKLFQITVKWLSRD